MTNSEFGLAAVYRVLKKSGFEIDDSITELKVENLDRPSKNYVYPIAFILFAIFGYLNFRRKPN